MGAHLYTIDENFILFLTNSNINIHLYFICINQECTICIYRMISSHFIITIILQFFQ